MFEMTWSLLDSFVEFYVHWDEKQKDIKDNCFLKMSMYFLMFSASLKTTIILLLYWHA